MKRVRKIKSGNYYIMSHDPSMTAWGWVILDQHGFVVDSGAIKTKPADKKLRIRKGDDRTRRVSEIVFTLSEWTKKYGVRHHVGELQHGSQSAVAATSLGLCVGILQTFCDCAGVGLEWFSEGDAKKSVCGKASIAKDVMVRLMSTKYETFKPRGVKWIDQAVADALAVHHVAMEQSSVLKFMGE